jgi:hypothetical protein
MAKKNESKTFRLPDGTIIFFGYDDFIKDIVKGECCFICGAQPNSKKFNNEHIIPQWLLRRFELYNKKIILPNLTKIQYRQYTVPCCVECNSDLSRVFETPLSELLSKPYHVIKQELHENPELGAKLFGWLCLLFFKTHLKDTTLLESLDKRKGEKKIGDRHWWGNFHHIHCLIRSHYTGARLDKGIFGSIYINKIIDSDKGFDYIDNPVNSTILVQIDDFCIGGVLDDSGATSIMLKNHLSKINSSLTINQFYEIFAHMNHISLNLKERPIFQSSISAKNGYQIKTVTPKIYELVKEDEIIGNVGEYLSVYVKRSLEDNAENKKIIEEIKQNKRSFLWNESGEFASFDKKNE